MKNKFLLLCPIVAISLSACAFNGKHYKDKSVYILDKSLDYKEDFRILQLTDVHLGDKDNQELHFKMMDLTINDPEVKPDLIVVTGDIFTFAGKSTVQRFFNWLDGHSVPWTVAWGNHDEQCYFSIDWMTGYLNNFGSNCYFKDIQDDDVQGNSNFAFNIMKDNKIFEQIIIMDSNRYDFGNGMYYDAFKPNQIEWYKDLVNKTTEINGELTQSLMFYHIPLPEINKLLEGVDKGQYEDGVINGYYEETTCPPSYNTGFFNVIKEMKSTKAMFFGHDHSNAFYGDYEGLTFSYGVKATSNIYYYEDPKTNFDLFGGQVITLHSDHSLSINRVYHSYAEVK